MYSNIYQSIRKKKTALACCLLVFLLHITNGDGHLCMSTWLDQARVIQSNGELGGPAIQSFCTLNYHYNQMVYVKIILHNLIDLFP